MEASHMIDSFIPIRRSGGRLVVEGRRVGNIENGQNEMSYKQASHITAGNNLKHRNSFISLGKLLSKE